MAKCRVCGKEMLRANGCEIAFVFCNEKKYLRETVEEYQADDKGRCYDCGAKVGFFHHWGCDQERCPRCGRQLLSCNCQNVYIQK